jgi:histidinol-phosphate aminotransferase
MPYLTRIMPGFCNVSAAASAAAIAALADEPYNRATVARIVADREALAIRLREIPGVVPLPSATNFLLVRLPVMDAGPVARELANRGVYVRHFRNPALGIADCLRVSVGRPEENMIFADELAVLLSEIEQER